jgi:hypothetical protein
MKKVLLLACLCIGFAPLFAQEAEETAKEAEKEKVWTKTAGLGLDFAQQMFINPRVGGGGNRIGFGGLSNFTANYKKERFIWNNAGSLQLGAQRIGDRNRPFEKNMDIIRLTSRASFRPGKSNIFAAVEADVLTLLLPTYQGNLLKPQEADARPISKFLSPVQVVISPGVEYKFNNVLTFLLSPFSMKVIYVGNDSIAALQVHGNLPGKNDFTQLGANLRVGYNQKFFKDRLAVISALDLYSNYIKNPQNIDVLWSNDIGLIIFKNFSINLVNQLFYDDDVKVQVDLDGNGIYGQPASEVNLPPGQQRDELAPSVSFMQGIFLKYNLIF